MGTLTEKQFIKAVGKIDKNKHSEFLLNHPIEYTDEWIYEYEKHRCLGKGYWCNVNHPIGAIHNGLDIETEGYYGQAMWEQEEW